MDSYQGLNRLLGWNVVYIVYVVRNVGALIAEEKLYICLCAAPLDNGI
jgi:hypothetical protein